MLWRFLLLPVVILSPLLAHAGLLLDWNAPDSRDITIYQDNTFIWIKNGQLNARFDFNQNQCLFIYSENQIYVQQSCTESFRQMENIDTTINILSQSELPSKQLPSNDRKILMVSTIRDGKHKVAGFNTDRYRIKLNGETSGQLWVSKELMNQVSEEIDLKKMQIFWNGFYQIKGRIAALIHPHMNWQLELRKQMLSYGIIIKEQISPLIDRALPPGIPASMLPGNTTEMKIEKRVIDLTDYKVPDNFTEMKNLEDFTRGAIASSLKQKQPERVE